MIVLDTDHISFLERAESPERERLLARLESPGTPEPVVTIISYEEQVRGWLAKVKSARSLRDQVDAYRRLQWQLEHYCAFKVLGFDERAAAVFQGLKRLKLGAGTMDLKLAAIVLSEEATLLSRNLRDFEQVPGLKVEDWTK
jgi:tRNA(fMet)-specific endonuclease VapC